jgi:hypothetical protein
MLSRRVAVKSPDSRRVRRYEVAFAFVEGKQDNLKPSRYVLDQGGTTPFMRA